MEIVIRSAAQNDYDLLLPLFRQVHEFHVSVRPDLYKENTAPVERGFFESQLADEKQHVFVAAEGDELVGFVVTQQEAITENSFVNARKVLVINSLCVAEAHRKKGIGVQLMHHVFDLGRRLQVNSIELGVSEENAAAIEFYKSLGMTTKSRRMEIPLE
ncbi:acetyltransferase [Planococcus salinarum]|uniref:Acetyltransferase n=1 Tax=Planococcus salinarum TaxID=622695 RepID=A0ABX3D1W2_9BACL|nr:GNAT family N-acetyltransferase [Planococcus salinarum]OHX53932.1 acetyltransferase [Planococcus salinarum]TAA73048.1 GNAT family N-acetyltransferase [Planococcus salinarum]